MNPPVTVVMATRNRAAQAVRTVARLRALPERPPVIVVDDASDDGTAEAVARAHPEVLVLRSEQNRGAAARTLGVEAATTAFVAFADDDSWWAPGALATAARHLEACPRLAVVAARVLVGPEERLDPVSAAMAASALGTPAGSPGPAVLGFLACGAVVRRSAYLEVGGFDPLLFFLGEEGALALDLARAGWQLAYVPDVVAHHHPGAVTRDGPARRRLQFRNDLLTAWTRRSARRAVVATVRAARAAPSDPVARAGLIDAVRRSPAAWRRRRRPPRWLERQVAQLERVPCEVDEEDRPWPDHEACSSA